MSPRLYMGMHHYSLVRNLASYYSIKCPVCNFTHQLVNMYYVKGRSIGILIAFG